MKAFPSIFPSKANKTSHRKRIEPAVQLDLIKKLPFKKRDGSIHFTPDYSFFPKSIRDLVGVMQLVHNTKKRMIVTSQGYSHSNMSPVADVLVYLQNLNRLSIEKRDAKKATLVLETGVTLQQVKRAITSSRFYFPVRFKVDKKKWGNAKASGFYAFLCAHPKSFQLIEWVEKVDLRGNVHRFDTASDGPGAIAEALRLGNQSGIIYRLGLKLER